MKKFLSITTFIALVLACSLPSVASANSSSNSPAVQIQVLSNTEEGQRVAYKVKSALTQKIDEHQYVSSYEIFVPFDEAEIKPFSYVGPEKGDNGIISKLKITYFCAVVAKILKSQIFLEVGLGPYLLLKQKIEK